MIRSGALGSQNKLSARTVETLKRPGRYSDGGNLYLSISANGGRRWVFMYRFAGRQREMGLGSASKAGTSLARAQELAAEARSALGAGLDPLEARKAIRLASRTVPTFGKCADAYVETHCTWDTALEVLDSFLSGASESVRVQTPLA